MTVLASFPLRAGAGELDSVRRLQLEVNLNGSPANLIGSFVELPNKKIAARRAELAEIGIKAPGSGADDDLVELDSIPGSEFRYDEATQTIFVRADDGSRTTKVYDARGVVEVATAPPQADWGAVLNYNAYAASTKASLGRGQFSFSGANTTVDARLFGPYGTVSQTAIIGTTATKDFDALRLETTWAYSDPESMRTYRAGDTISGALPWTRSIRLAGIQAQTNFSLRPDLVTAPLPSFAGSASVPSTVDVYVNSLKTYSQPVADGPFQINNLPTVSGAGTARIVVQDSAGKAIETSLPFFTSPKLLREGLTNFSVEAGLPRMNYGIASDAYLNQFVASGTARIGVFDWLTAEAHAETGVGVANIGVGTVTQLSSWGVLSLGAAASRFEQRFGFQTYAGFDTQIRNLSLHLSTQRSFQDFEDLSSAIARHIAVSPLSWTSQSPAALTYVSQLTARPARALDIASVGIPLPGFSSVNFSYIHLKLDQEKPSHIVSASYSRPLFDLGVGSISAFSNVAEKKNYGVFAGFSMPLSGSISAYSGVSSSSTTGTNYNIEVAKPLVPEDGSYGWRIRDSEGSSVYRSAGAAYRSSVGQLSGEVRQDRSNLGGNVQAQGSITTMGGGVFLSNRIDDAFAVVDVGLPDVEVLSENRPSGKTASNGKILIPNLRSYQKNNVGIDATTLPVDADIALTQDFVAPTDRSGVVVKMGARKADDKAVVVFTDGKGKFLPAGSKGRVNDSDEAFIVGYDGRAYVSGLKDQNVASVEIKAGECRAAFSFSPKANGQAVIEGVACR